MSTFFFVDCEGHGPAAGLNDHLKFEIGVVAKVTEEYALAQRDQFGATCRSLTALDSGKAVTDVVSTDLGKVATFYGIGGMKGTFTAFREWLLAIEPRGRCVFVSDNPAYDWQFPNFYFHKFLGANPFGHSARRIGDYYAGLCGDFSKTQEWKRLRRTTHDHHPVHDAMGNLEAFEEIRAIGGAHPPGLTHAQIIAACKNFGYDLSCGECASIFYTGMGGQPHTCGR